jgi:phosphomevalonate kinase
MNETFVSKPGKFYLMGEYGVVSGRSDALILATKARLRVVVKDHLYPQIASNQWPQTIPFQIRDNRVVWTKNEPWVKALNLVLRYLLEDQRKWHNVSIEITSELDQDATHKWGIGSSGALVTAMIQALLTHFGYSFSALDWYRLAVLAEIDDALLTSFGDLAVSCFETAIRYHMPDRAWLGENQELPIATLLSTPWPGLVIEPLDLMPLPLVVVHSNQPASSHQLVARVFHSGHADEVNELLKQIGQVVSDGLRSWRAGDWNSFAHAIKEHHQVILRLDQLTHAGIQTDRLREIEAIGDAFGLTCKYSGAGGGDNLLFFYTDLAQRAAFEARIASKFPLIQSLIEGVRP